MPSWLLQHFVLFCRWILINLTGKKRRNKNGKKTRKTRKSSNCSYIYMQLYIYTGPYCRSYKFNIPQPGLIHRTAYQISTQSIISGWVILGATMSQGADQTIHQMSGDHRSHSPKFVLDIRYCCFPKAERLVALFDPCKNYGRDGRNDWVTF